MKNKEMLRKIYYENKAINRNMQRLVNIGLIGILGGIAKEAKASDDPKAKILVKAGMVMIAITEGLLLFSDILDYRKSRIEKVCRVFADYIKENSYFDVVWSEKHYNPL